MFKTAQEVLLANTMISVQDYAACWAEGGGVVLRVDREKPFAPLSQAVGQEGWIFYTVTTVLPFPGEIRDKHEEGGPSGGQENRPWEEGEARRRKVLATQHERGSCFQGYSKDRIPPLCYPIVTGRSCLAPPSSSKMAHLLTVLWPGITGQNTKPQHLSQDNRVLLSLPVTRIKC